MGDKVYCKECAYCYRIQDRYAHIDGDDYHCANSDMSIRRDYLKIDSPLERPVVESLIDTTCIYINKNNKCKGFRQLEVTKIPIFPGLAIGNRVITNKVKRDIDER